MMPLKILFVSSEVAPFAKLGGVADVVGSLPKSLRQLGHDVRIVMPAYQHIERGETQLAPMPITIQVPVRDGVLAAGVFTGKLPDTDIPVYAIAEKNLFARPMIYGYDDDLYRFAFFGRAVYSLISALDWKPDIVHAHDWQAAAAIFWLDTVGRFDPRYAGISTLFTIHNLGHQGHGTRDLLDYLLISAPPIYEEAGDQFSFMARGIYHADRISTVSPTYAEEILTREGGAGLDGLLRSRKNDLVGIMNGLDHERWNPLIDPHLPVHFDLNSLDRKRALRRALQAKTGLPPRGDIPLLGMVSRLDWQKGMDITIPAIHRLLSGEGGEVQLVILGRGEPRYEEMLASLAAYYPQKFHLFLEYDEELASLIYGACDIYLMPSLFEPCGLGQLIAMRYGTVPIVRATGGMKDSIEHGRTGFVFLNYSIKEFYDAMASAVYVYHHDQELFRFIQYNGLTRDFSWDHAARQYEEIYYNSLS